MGIVKDTELTKKQEALIASVRKIWDTYDIKDDALDLPSFYESFMAPYFGCYRSEEARKCLSAIDMDENGKVEWSEFEVYLMWAAKEYPDITTPQQLIQHAFNYGIKQSSEDEVIGGDRKLSVYRRISLRNK